MMQTSQRIVTPARRASPRKRQTGPDSRPMTVWMGWRAPVKRYLAVVAQWEGVPVAQQSTWALLAPEGQCDGHWTITIMAVVRATTSWSGSRTVSMAGWIQSVWIWLVPRTSPWAQTARGQCMAGRLDQEFKYLLILLSFCDILLR